MCCYLENNFAISPKFTNICCNCKQQLTVNNNPRISYKVGFTIEDKALIINT
jgi:hypothetical protein